MKIRVNPTRMALLRLRKRLSLARRGHKLLKDKLEGLVKAFMPLVDAYGQARRKVDRDLPATLRLFALAGAVSGEAAIEEALEECDTRLDVEIVSKPVMNIPIPSVSVKGFELRSSYSALATTSDFDRASASLRDIFPTLLDLASLEEGVVRMAAEIEKTRRRVNALEYVLIPSLRQTVRSIAAKLEEDDRATRARLTKIKDMLRMAE
ncbi:MAG TPA: V-type ATP synthase subunit D [Candidatus Brocadiia bacterium]|nr:V-type ATP synthase subunit D [Candidatus Brocadiia bacterium]